LPSALPIWLTLSMGLVSLWAPLFNGLLQGAQNFLWIGWKEMVNGAGRLLATYVIVFHVSATAVGVLSAALLALLASLVILVWQSRGVWLAPSARFDWSDWGRRLIGLTLGFGAFLFMMSADAVILRAHFSETEIAPYNGAGTLARAIVTFTAPLAAVMFPKIVHSLVHAQRTDAHKLTLLGAAVLSTGAAIGLSLLAPLVLSVGFRPSFASSAPLLPGYAWAMVPLALANVLISDLMARSRFVASPWLALVAAGYGVTLAFHHETFQQVILILGGFNTLLMVVAAGFTWQRRAGK
jgi:O-antigen/teichoic acid export membrane protein